MVWQFAHVCYRKGSYDGHERESLWNSQRTPAWIFSVQFSGSGVSSTRVHDLITSVAGLRSNRTTFKKLKWYLSSSLSCICRMWWNHFRGVTVLLFSFFFLLQRHHMLISRTFYWAASKFGTGLESWTETRHWLLLTEMRVKQECMIHNPEVNSRPTWIFWRSCTWYLCNYMLLFRLRDEKNKSKYRVNFSRNKAYKENGDNAAPERKYEQHNSHVEININLLPPHPLTYVFIEDIYRRRCLV